MIIIGSPHSPFLRDIQPILKTLSVYGIPTGETVLNPDHNTDILEIIIPLSEQVADKTLAAALHKIKTPLKLCARDGRISIRLEGTR